MDSRSWLVLLALIALLPGCAATVGVAPSRPTTGTIRGVLRLPSAGAGTPMAAAHGGAPGAALAETPLDAVVYVEPIVVAASPAKVTAMSAAARSSVRRVEPASKTDPRATTAAREDDDTERYAHPLDARRKPRDDPEQAPASRNASSKPGDRTAAKRAATPSQAKPSVYGPPTKQQAAAAVAASKTAARAEPPAAERGAKASRVAGAARAAKSVPPGTVEPGATDPARERIVIAQTEHRFVPRVQPVALGATVHFENRDKVWHNVFSISPARRFDVGKYPPRQARTVTFDAPGVVQLYSDIDPAMAGFVFVSPTPYFTKPDASGVFALPDLPAGSYLLKVWHPTLGRLTRRVELTGQGGAHLSLAF